MNAKKQFYPSQITNCPKERWPDAIVFFDCETVPVQETTDAAGTATITQRLGLVCWKLYKRDGDGYRYIFSEHCDDADVFIRNLYLASETYKFIWVLCHNANYDIRAIGLLTNHERHGLYWYKPSEENKSKASVEIKFLSLERGSFGFSMYTENGELFFGDTYNWFPTSVDNLGERLGKPKMDMPADISSPEMLAYCFRDVEIIAESTLQLIEQLKENGWGSLKSTLASTSFAIWRSAFLEYPYPVPKSARIRERSRLAYHGGFVWPFFIGEMTGQFFQLDVRSMYPFIMKTLPVPGVYLETLANVSSDEVMEICHDKMIVGLFEVHNCSQPMPVRIGKRTLYCVGNFYTWLTTHEVRQLHKSGADFRGVRVMVFTAHLPFTRYINALIASREDYENRGDKFAAFVAKLWMNSLYGKFGQLNPKWIYSVEKPPFPKADLVVEIDGFAGETYRKERIGNLVRERVGVSESYYSHPAIAAHITAGARCRLFELISLAGWDNVFYCDTDSILTNETGLENLACEIAGEDPMLGQLQMEFKAWRLSIKGKKDYKLDCVCTMGGNPNADAACVWCKGRGFKERLKGIKPSAKRLDESQRHSLAMERPRHQTDLINPAYTVFSQFEVDNLKALFRKGTDGELDWTEKVKVLQRRFHDGALDEEGFTRFFHLSMDDFHFYLANLRAWEQLGY